MWGKGKTKRGIPLYYTNDHHCTNKLKTKNYLPMGKVYKRVHFFSVAVERPKIPKQIVVVIDKVVVAS